MAWMLVSSLVAGLVKLKCPHCRTAQVRGVKEKGEPYRCTTCHKTFTREEGEKAVRSPY